MGTNAQEKAHSRDLTGIVKGHRRALRLYIPVAGRVLLRSCILLYPV